MVNCAESAAARCTPHRPGDRVRCPARCHHSRRLMQSVVSQSLVSPFHPCSRLQHARLLFSDSSLNSTEPLLAPPRHITVGSHPQWLRNRRPPAVLVSLLPLTTAYGESGEVKRGHLSANSPPLAPAQPVILSVCYGPPPPPVLCGDSHPQLTRLAPKRLRHPGALPQRHLGIRQSASPPYFSYSS